MSVGTFEQPDHETQTGTEYKTAIDNAVAVHQRIGGAFAPHEQSTPDMTVRLDAGALFPVGGVVEVAAQNTGTITAPTSNPRIDRVVIDNNTGTFSVITGVEAASPSPPSIPLGKSPVAKVNLLTSTTAITNSIIEDERVAFGGSAISAWPIGSVYLSVVSTNPATLLGFGTWAQIAQGQMLVGYQSGDANFGTVEGTGGAKTKNLAHTHTGPNHVHEIGGSGVLLVGQGSAIFYGGTENTGSGGSATQDILPPYFTVYMWKRTA